jgi:TolB protein
VSNGPLLELEVGGKGPGETIETTSETVDWTLSVYSALPFDKVEIFVNGTVALTFEGNPVVGHKSYQGTVDVPSGGWITARVTGANTGWPAMESHLFAESSPIWFRAVGSTDPTAARQSAEVLLRALNVAAKNVREGYGNVPIPQLLGHFERARDRLRAMTRN